MKKKFYTDLLETTLKVYGHSLYNIEHLTGRRPDNPSYFPPILGICWAVLDYLRLNHGYFPPKHRHIVIHCWCPHLTVHFSITMHLTIYNVLYTVQYTVM